MSAVVQSLFGEGLGVAASVFGNVVTIIPRGNIGGIQVQATLEETAIDTLCLTEHPVEAGAEITDHAYVRMPELIMRCGWSNSNGGLFGVLRSLVSGSSLQQAVGLAPASATAASNGMLVSDYVSSVYSQLLALQTNLQPFTVSTTIRQYQNMMLTSVTLTRDHKTSQALKVVAAMRQILFVNTISTQLPPQANQATPAATAETINTGQVQLQSGALPSNGGSKNIFNWPPGSDEAANNVVPDN